MLKPFIASALLISSGWAIAAEPAMTAARYAQQLGVGMDVDWARTERGIREFDPLVVRDFRAKGISHVRIRVADEPTEARLIHLRKLVEASSPSSLIRPMNIKTTRKPIMRKRQSTGGLPSPTISARATRSWVLT